MEPEECGTRTADMAGLDRSEPQDRRLKNSENGGSRTADPAFAEPRDLRPSYTDKRKTDKSYMEVCPSVTDRQEEEKSLPTFWMPVSSPLLSLKWHGYLKTPLSGCSTQIASVLGTPRCHKAVCAAGSKNWMSWRCVIRSGSYEAIVSGRFVIPPSIPCLCCSIASQREKAIWRWIPTSTVSGLSKGSDHHVTHQPAKVHYGDFGEGRLYSP